MKQSIITFFATLAIVLVSVPLFAQFKTIENTDRQKRNSELTPVLNFQNVDRATTTPIRSTPISQFGPMNLVQSHPELQMKVDKENGLPIFIKGSLSNLNAAKSADAQCFDFLGEVKSQMQILNPMDEFTIVSNESDELGMQHIKMQQFYKGIEVFGSQVFLHKTDQKIDLLNGRYFPTPKIGNTNPTLSATEAEAIVQQDRSDVKVLSSKELELLNMNQVTSELVIYHKDLKVNQERLVYHITIFPNIIDRWEYFVDAHTGEIVNKYTYVCKFHNHELSGHENCSHHNHAVEAEAIAPAPQNFMPPGPLTANAQTLFGNTVTINVWQEGSTYFLFDGSRNMFNSSQSNVPSDPVGMVVTIDAQNTYPGNSNFNYDVIANNSNNWNNPTAVSAHHNGGLAYQYFEDTFGRNSINGSGGNIISLINVADENGNDMDNAFWNGQAMFYGNGNQAFTSPLPKALDVAGHEMSHGVVQGTANLTYQGQSGALNESFADIFGAMIDRDDWKVGEDVSNPSIFPNGAIRDMSNPHNGGTQLGDPGWQPDHMNEIYTGSQDNGGVHINSGIPNKAFHAFATAVGKAKAEQVYYRALVNYLTASSNFIDCRNAVEQAAIDLHGAGSTEVNAVQNAFASVGLGAGSGSPTAPQEDVETNLGDDYILLTDANFSAIYLANPDGTILPNGNPLTSSDILSKPSVTDDGTAFVFVGSDKKLYAVGIDWDNGTIDEYVIQDEAIWRNVIISKDGERIAAVEDNLENFIYVFDFGISSWGTFELYNPTYTEGISTGDVLFSDAMEFDFNGEEIMYDANNSIASTTGDALEYWDVSFIKVWNGSNFGTGDVSKLFSGLPENVSVGNATFSKNSPYIIAYDYFDFVNNEYAVMGANIETGSTGTIFQNGRLGYPNYSVKDDQIIFDAEDSNGDDVLGVIDLQGNKITGVNGTAQVLIPGGQWGVWFAVGNRDLMVGTEENLAETVPFTVFPNPFDDQVLVQYELQNSTDAQLQVVDMFGKTIYNRTLTTNSGLNEVNLPLQDIAAGTYIVQLTAGEFLVAKKIVKY